MRIALMPSGFAPFVGGVEELTRNLAGALVEAGDEVEVWTSNPDGTGTIGPIVLDGLRVRRFDFALPAMSARSIVPAQSGRQQRCERFSQRSARFARSWFMSNALGPTARMRLLCPPFGGCR